MCQVDNHRIIGNGKHAEYSTITAERAVKVPDNLGSESASLAIVGRTAMHGVRRAAIEYGDNVAVVGLGLMGQLAIQHARLAGAGRTIAVEVDPWRLEVAEDLLYKELDLRPSRGGGQPENIPPHLLRWNGRRNLEFMLSLLAKGRIRTKELITHVLPFEEIKHAYEIIRTRSEPSLHVALERNLSFVRFVESYSNPSALTARNDFLNASITVSISSGVWAVDMWNW